MATGQLGRISFFHEPEPGLARRMLAWIVEDLQRLSIGRSIGRQTAEPTELLRWGGGGGVLSLWLSSACPVPVLWLSFGFPLIFLWFSFGFPLVFLWFSFGFPLIFL